MKLKLFFLFLAPVFCIAQTLSPIEKQLNALIEKNHSETLALLQKVANINSGTLNAAGVYKVGQVFKEEFEKIGFKTEWVKLPDSLKRAGHLVATRVGNKGKKLFLIGHLDTVFEENMPFTPYTVLNDSTAKGQGVSDMKGGNVMILASLKALHQLKLLDNTHITVYFTGDEEFAGRPLSVSRRDFMQRAAGHDMALAYETTVAVNIATTATRGIGGWKLEVEGRQGHSAGIFNNISGFGAIYEMSRILNEFQVQFPKEEYLTVNVGMISGGSEVAYMNEAYSAIGKTNIIPRKAVAEGDLRYISIEQQNKTRAKMQEIVSKSLHKTKAKITFSEGIPSMPPSAKNDQILKLFDASSRAMGMGAVTACDPGLRGAGDIAYVANILPCLDGLGAAGTGAHSPTETIDLKSYPALIKRNTVFLYRLLQ